MGITDNLFNRKSDSHRQHVPRTVNGVSQQYRLNKFKGYFTEEPKGESTSAGVRHSPKSAVTRYVVVEDRRGLPSSTPYSSMTNLTLSTNFTEAEIGFPNCICFRDACALSCSNLNCNWSGVGRIRSLCPSHPTVTFLLDLPQCPQCLGRLDEMTDRQPDDDNDDDL